MKIPQSKRFEEHTQLICDIGEVGGLFRDVKSLDTFLLRIVDMIAAHMKCDVCSIYFYVPENKELVLRATKGLNPDLISSVKLKLGEGLTGLALKELRPIAERNASSNANFKYFPNLGEEDFESFLAVPISRGTNMIGAMVIQNTAKDYFTDEDVSVLKAISSQLANTIETTRLLLSMEGKKKEPVPELSCENLKVVKGKSAASGVSIGEAFVFNAGIDLWDLFADQLDVPLTLVDFHKAMALSEKQLEDHQDSIEEKLSDVASLIFTAQILMLKDKGFTESMISLIESGTPVVAAVITVVQDYAKRFENLPNPYLQEKSHDVKDIGKRLLENLIGQNDTHPDLSGKIIIAKELFPSDALKLSSQKIKGIVLLTGGVTSHLSILARSLHIPLMIADERRLLTLPSMTPVILDADVGNLYISPDDEALASYKDKESSEAMLLKMQEKVTPETFTADGQKICLMSNINLLGDVKTANDFKSEGVGLYRTEFPFIVRSDFPSESEQFVVYQKLVEGMPDKEINFRTLDIGGDKVLSYFEHHLKEKNPYLGMRSIRFSLKHVDIFCQQIRAILKAGASHPNVRILFPMISSIDEFMTAKRIVMQCVEDLEREGAECLKNPSIGVMIELPSVLEIIEELADVSDFFSIGTNDFIQYMLAVDRTNEKVSDLYLPHHPAILRALKKVVEAGLKYGKDVSVCGDMSHDPLYTEFLLGIGVRKLSLNPTYIPKIQETINNIDMAQANKFANNLLKQSRLREINKILNVENI